MTLKELEGEVVELTGEIDDLQVIVKSFELSAKRSSLPFIPALELLALIDKRTAVQKIISDRKKRK